EDCLSGRGIPFAGGREARVELRIAPCEQAEFERRANGNVLDDQQRIAERLERGVAMRARGDDLHRMAGAGVELRAFASGVDLERTIGAADEGATGGGSDDDAMGGAALLNQRDV